MPLLILFILIPIIEIALFIKVGGFIGLWPTLAIVILTAVIGTNMLRTQGLSALARLQSSLQTGQNPVDPIIHGALIMLSGVLLLTPGFFTDSIGFLLLIPAVRAALIKWGAAKAFGGSFVVMGQGRGQQPPEDPSVLDGDFSVLDDTPENPGDSGWTKR